MSDRDDSVTGDSAPRINVTDPAVRDLLPRYLARRRADAERIGELLAEQRFAEVRVLAHNMRGSGAAYGIEFVTEIGKTIEQAARRGEGEAIERAARDLHAFLDQTRIE